MEFFRYSWWFARQVFRIGMAVIIYYIHTLESSCNAILVFLYGGNWYSCMVILVFLYGFARVSFCFSVVIWHRKRVKIYKKKIRAYAHTHTRVDRSLRVRNSNGCFAAGRGLAPRRLRLSLRSADSKQLTTNSPAAASLGLCIERGKQCQP